MILNHVKGWWKALTLNEKLLHLLILAFSIGIITRWEYVSDEVVEGFRSIFLR